MKDECSAIIGELINCNYEEAKDQFEELGIGLGIVLTEKEANFTAIAKDVIDMSAVDVTSSDFKALFTSIAYEFRFKVKYPQISPNDQGAIDAITDELPDA